MTPKRRSEIFWSKIEKTDTCWFWTSYHNTNGRPYTSKQVEGKHGIELVYRRVWRELVGPLTSDIHLHHTCENFRCVNPAHMTPLDIADHARLHAAENPKTHCPQGHPYEGTNVRYRKNRGKKDGARVCCTCDSLRKRTAYARKTGRTLDQIRPQKRKHS